MERGALKTIGLALAISVLLCGNAASSDRQTANDPPVVDNRLDSWFVALILGMAIGSEDVCGHVYDRARVDAFVAANVDADDAEFAELLEQSIEAGEYIFQRLKGPETKERCAEWRDTAGRYGLE